MSIIDAPDEELFKVESITIREILDNCEKSALESFENKDFSPDSIWNFVYTFLNKYEPSDFLKSEYDRIKKPLPDFSNFIHDALLESYILALYHEKYAVFFRYFGHNAGIRLRQRSSKSREIEFNLMIYTEEYDLAGWICPDESGISFEHVFDYKVIFNLMDMYFDSITPFIKSDFLKSKRTVFFPQYPVPFCYYKCENECYRSYVLIDHINENKQVCCCENCFNERFLNSSGDDFHSSDKAFMETFNESLSDERTLVPCFSSLKWF
jgi:hypothetical protein